MKGLGPLFNRALLVAGIAGIFYPAFIEGPAGSKPPGFTQAIIALFLEPHLELGYFMRVLCVFAAICSGYILVITKWYQRVPITVVKTNIVAEFNSDLSRAVVSREQTLRANQSGVTAYFSGIWPTTKNATVPISEITMDAFCHGCTLNSSFDYTGSDHSGFEIIQSFGREMPYKWYMPILPGWLLNKAPEQMFNFVRNSLVTRSQSAVYVNEFNAERPVMTFVASNYPQLNVSVTLRFSSEVPQNFRVKRVKSNGVVDQNFEKEGRSNIKIFVDRLQNETLRIVWA